jgi:parallel beta-helix repeat protein
MRFTKQIIVLIALMLMASPFLLATSTARSNPCTVTVNGENGSDNAIQSAINANPGGTICVASGTYPEQLAITSSGTQLIGLGTILHPTIIQPTSVAINSPATGDAAIILVGSSGFSITGVVLENLNIEGMAASSSPSIASSAVTYSGILYLNAGGTIANNVVNGVILPVADTYFAGYLSGFGIAVWSEAGQTSTVSITSNTVSNYNWGGIVCYGSGTTCTVRMNVVSFYTPYESTQASDGIFIWYALATVNQNIVTNNYCTESPYCTTNYFTGYQSNGIQTLFSAPGTIISGNIVIHCDIGITMYSDTAQVVGNIVLGSRAYAIEQIDGAGTYVASFNVVAGNPIGYEVVNDGGNLPSFASIIGSGNVFGSDPVKIQIQAEAYYGPASVTLTYASHTYVVTATSATTPTTKDIY